MSFGITRPILLGTINVTKGNVQLLTNVGKSLVGEEWKIMSNLYCRPSKWHIYRYHNSLSPIYFCHNLIDPLQTNISYGIAKCQSYFKLGSKIKLINDGKEVIKGLYIHSGYWSLFEDLNTDISVPHHKFYILDLIYYLH